MLVFLTVLLTPGILFSTAVRVVVEAKVVILSILFSTSFILTLRVVLGAKLVISSALPLIILILVLYTSFLTTSFLLRHLVYLNQQEQVLTYQHLIYLVYISNCFNYFVHFPISQYLIYLHRILKLQHQVFLATSDASSPNAFVESAFIGYLAKSDSNFTFRPIFFGSGKYSLFILCHFCLSSY